MAKTEARYQVYLRDVAMVAEIEEYCEKNEISAAEFGRRAFEAYLEEN
jgi:hypothetical protein